MRRNILALFLILSLFFFNASFQIYIRINPFSANDAKERIEYLSSSTFNGRLAGTFENVQAAAYVKNEFIQNNLDSFNGSYYDSFTTKYPQKLESSPYLKVVDSKGNIIKEFTYGKDYKEDMLNFKINHLIFGKADSAKFGDGYLQITKGENQFLFYVPQTGSLNFRSSFMTTASRAMYIMITSDTLNDIKKYTDKGYRIDCYIPFEIKDTTLNNVTAFIEGKNPSLPPVVLTAHFDHLGSDLSNNIYSGALDNASGISFLIELSKYVKSLGRPERSILFVGFNAEEFGCLGSEAFVEKYDSYLKGSKVFNFDMIGTDNKVPLYIMGGKMDTSKSALMRSVSSTCTNQHIDFNYLFEDASDHEAFRKHGIDAITFADNDMTRIHTPEDKSKYISTDSIDRCYKVASREVIKYAFEGNIILVYYKEMLFFSSLVVLLVSLIAVAMDNRRRM